MKNTGNNHSFAKQGSKLPKRVSPTVAAQEAPEAGPGGMVAESDVVGQFSFSEKILAQNAQKEATQTNVQFA